MLRPRRGQTCESTPITVVFFRVLLGERFPYINEEEATREGGLKYFVT